jgi:hypothetical protein
VLDCFQAGIPIEVFQNFILEKLFLLECEVGWGKKYFKIDNRISHKIIFQVSVK